MNSIGNIFRSKAELYTLLQNYGGFYLPPLEKTSCIFLKDVLVGKKLLLKVKAVEPTGKIPQLEEFRVKNLWELFKERPDFKVYFPDINPQFKQSPR